MSIKRLSDDVAAVREDVAFIRGQMEEGKWGDRLRSLERKWYGVPASIVIALLGLIAAFIH